MDDRDPVVERAIGALPEPPPARRDALWAKIEAELRAAPRAVPAPRIVWSRRVAAALQIAAVLALGIAVGRFKSPQPPEGASSQAVAALRPVQRRVLEEHFALTDVLLADLEAGDAPAGLATRARDLWSATQVLLDSPAAARDPELRAFLADLDLLLAQVSRLDGAGDDLEFVRRTLEARDVRARLHRRGT